MTPRPYFRKKVASQMSHAGIDGVVLLLSNIVSTKSWYDAASLAKRQPAEFTAINPGLARSSTRCGNRPLLPSRRGTIETGDHSPLVHCPGLIAAPRFWPSCTPSPLFPSQLIQCAGTG